MNFAELFSDMHQIVKEIRDISHFHRDRTTDMLAQIQALQTSMTALSAQAALNSTKIDSLIALAQKSATTGTAVSQEDLDAITAASTQADQLAAELKTADDKADAELGPGTGTSDPVA